MKKHLVILSLVSMMIGCRTIEEPSAVDLKPTNTEENIDQTIKPGDNFFMYANGSWWDKTSLGTKSITGLIVDAAAAADGRMKNLRSASIDHFWNNVSNVDQTTAASIDLIKENLKLAANITTNAQAQDALIQLMLGGYDNLIQTRDYLEAGVVKIGLIFPTNFGLNPQWLEYCFEKLGFVDSADRAEKAMKLYAALEAHKAQSANLSRSNLEQHPEVLERMVSFAQTKSTGSGVLSEQIAKALDLNPNIVTVDKEMIKFYNTLYNAAPDQFQALLQAYIVSDLRFTARASYDQYQQISTSPVTFDKAMEAVKQSKMLYTYSYFYAKQYVTADSKAKIERYCQEFRTTLHRRIAQLDWMSGPTKQKAKEKLDAMCFNVGYPDTWIERGVADLKGGSLLEDMQTLTKTHLGYIKGISVKPGPEAALDNLLSVVSIHVINASYDPYANAINILPVWLDEPFYDEKMSDAYNYANFSIVGHEIIHGFDSNGAGYNKVGAVENWWTVSDMMEFRLRQKKLVDCYNLLEIMPKELPNIYADGTSTLAENMADLGGIILVYEAYKTRLEMDGYRGEELVKQKRKFFQSLANLFRLKYTANYATEARRDDPHSLGKERVNGVVMNMDDWYDLYDVQWGDNLYLKPEKRTYLW